jgi:ATP-dependent RNA helicase DDX27
LTALEDFRCGNVDVLLATDLAASGLDIDRVQTVINFEMPSQLAIYVHRIGRTAREVDEVVH